MDNVHALLSVDLSQASEEQRKSFSQALESRDWEPAGFPGTWVSAWDEAWPADDAQFFADLEEEAGEDVEAAADAAGLDGYRLAVMFSPFEATGFVAEAET